MKKTTLIGLTALLAVSLIFLNRAAASTINWIDVSAVPGTNSVDINDPILGLIRVTTDTPAQAIFSGRAGSLPLESLDWLAFNYINYDASQTGPSGTSAPIMGTMTFEFIDGPIDTALTPIFFSSNGLAAGSSYTINNTPVYLGDIRDSTNSSADGSGTHTPIGADLLLIEGIGNNHFADLIQFNNPFISSISIDIDQVMGDGAGFALGSVAPALVPIPATLWLLISACATLVGFRRSASTTI